ncbi:MAG: sulfatase [Opitutae bacterium]|nr:sulfatase [Opitutae bacterium]
MKNFGFILLFLFFIVSAFGIKPNILFIAIDDLRPELGCYGSPIAMSPNLDKLAREGRRFDRAYCQQSICSPSRASLMTGVRPDEIGVIENTAYFRDLNPNIVTLPQHFIKNGYEAVYCGKIYHGRMTDEKYSWSRKPAHNLCPVKMKWFPGGYALLENQELWATNKEKMLAKYGKEGSGGLIHGPAYESADVPDHAYSDGYSTRLAISTLKDHRNKKPDQPLFLALGFKKPHLDFVAPKKYWDMYDREKIQLAKQTDEPVYGASTGLHASFELRTRHGIPKKGPIGPDLAKTLLHGYYACVSYVDAQIGLMLEALDEAGIRDDTVIVVWGDHGWHLGEMGIWGKATNYEIATRVPLIVWTPKMKQKGKGTNALVELVDLYPTLCDLAGLSKPKHLSGKSLVPQIENPDTKGKKFAVSQFPNPALREWAANPLSPGMRKTFFGPLIEEVENRIRKQQGKRWDRELFENHLMGYTIRSGRYRMVAWLDYRDVEAEPFYVELYDHRKDPTETRNIAHKLPSKAQELLKKLRDSGIGERE